MEKCEEIILTIERCSAVAGRHTSDTFLLFLDPSKPVLSLSG